MDAACARLARPRRPLYDSPVSAGANDAPTVLIMAAGEGTRMRSAVPEAAARGLRQADGRLAGARRARGRRGARRRDRLARSRSQRGPARAAPRSSSSPRPTAPAAPFAPRSTWFATSATVVVLNGDHPLVSGELVISELLEAHRGADAAATVMSVERDDAEQLGRIVRDSRRRVRAHRRDQAPRGGRSRGARDPRDQHQPSPSRPARSPRRSAGSAATTPPASTTSATCCR